MFFKTPAAVSVSASDAPMHTVPPRPRRLSGFGIRAQQRVSHPPIPLIPTTRMARGREVRAKGRAKPDLPRPHRCVQESTVQFAKSGSCNSSQDCSSPHMLAYSPLLKGAKRMGAAKAPKLHTRPPGSVNKIEEVAALAVGMPCIGSCRRCPTVGRDEKLETLAQAGPIKRKDAP